MTPLLPALMALLAASAAAQEFVLPPLDPRQTLAACLAQDTDVRNYVHSYDRDDEARVEFQRLYAAYSAMVVKRRNEGWSNGGAFGLGNLATNASNAMDRYGSAWWLPWKNPPQWDESRTKLEELIAKTRVDLAHARTAEERARIKAQQEEYETFANGRFGVCNDWQHETADALRRAGPQKFTVRETAIDGATSSTSHAYVLVCPRADDSHCVAFDPWKRGLPELFTDNEAARGPSHAHGCFTDAPPPGAR
jgi:hypothetical protein